MLKQQYRVRELARLCGVNPRTIDYYTTSGLLTPVARSKGGHRFYDDDAVRRLRLIKSLQAQGMSLEAIRERLAAARDESELLARFAALQAELQRLEAEVAELAPQVSKTATQPPHNNPGQARALQIAVAGATTYALALAQELVDLLNQGSLFV